MDGFAVLQRLGGGRLIDEVVSALEATAAEVVDTGNPGTVTVKLKLSTKSQGDVMVIVDETVSRTSPTRPAKGAYFFAVEDDEGETHLYRDDPRQPPLPEMRSIDTTTGEIREAMARERVERQIR